MLDIVLKSFQRLCSFVFFIFLKCFYKALKLSRQLMSASYSFSMIFLYKIIQRTNASTDCRIIPKQGRVLRIRITFHHVNGSSLHKQCLLKIGASQFILFFPLICLKIKKTFLQIVSRLGVDHIPHTKTMTRVEKPAFLFVSLICCSFPTCSSQTHID